MRGRRTAIVIALALGAVLAPGVDVRAQALQPGIVPCPAGTNVASPIPLESASSSSAPPSAGPPSAAPSPAASTPPTSRLRLTPRALQLNAGMCARVIVAGGTPPYTALAAAGNAGVASQPDGSLIVTALRNGKDVLTVADAGGATATLNVLIAPDAGVVPAAVTLRVAGNGLTARFLAAALAAEIARQAQLQPGARVAPLDSRSLPATLSSAAPWNGTVAVTLAGHDRWRDVQGVTAVQAQAIDLPRVDPPLLFYSDDPETILDAQAGVLFRASLTRQNPTARVFAYHEFELANRQLYLVLRSPGTSHVQLIGDVAGPGFTGDAGHKVTVRYLQARRTQRSVVANVDTNPLVLEIGNPSEALRLVTGIYDLALIDGDPIDVALVAGFASGDPGPLDLIGGALPSPPPPIVRDGHDRSGVYALDALAPIALSASITDAYRLAYDVGTFVRVGTWTVPPIAGKRYLRGDYGVVRPLRITMTNVTGQPGTVYLYIAPSANGDTTSIRFDDGGLDADGMPIVFDTKCLVGSKDPPLQTRYLLRAFTVAPTRGGSPVVVTGEFMTDGGSTYPIELGLSLDPPLPRPPTSMCTPPPSPAPSPLPSPSPSP